MNKIFAQQSEAPMPAKYSDDELRAQGWPVDFDFDTDHVCQTVFKPFIEEQLQILEEYDAKRDHKSDYHFHIHAVDAARDVRQTCLNLGLGERVAKNMYYATLIHDIGKPELDPQIWDFDDATDEEKAQIKAEKRQHIHTGTSVLDQFLDSIKSPELQEKAKAHPFAALAREVIENHHERMDGLGEKGLKADDLSMPVRLVCIVEDYDGNSHLRPHHVAQGLKNDPVSIFMRMDEKRKGWFDEGLLDAFRKMKTADYYNNVLKVPLPENDASGVDFAR